MTRNQPYNGHKNWAHWNVALWIGNDEGLYRLAIDCVGRAGTDRYGKARTPAKTLDRATRKFIALVDTRTPDGARYSIIAVRAALAGLVE